MANCGELTSCNPSILFSHIPKFNSDRQQMFTLSAVVFLLSEDEQAVYSDFLLYPKFCGVK